MSQQARWNAAHPEVIKAAMLRLERRNLEIVAAELDRRGGHCVYPGCTETKIEWHHRDPATKTVSIGGSVRLHSVARLTAELALCDPLCRRHHMVIDGRSDVARNYWRVNKRVQTSRKAGSKLTEDEVRAIRRRYERGVVTQGELGDTYGIAASAVSQIVNRRLWSWLSD